VEQLLAESTGKEGTGIIPIVHEPLGLPELYGDDRLFIHLALMTDDEQQNEHILSGIANAGHPVLHFHLAEPYELGGQFVLWEWATAIAGHRLGIHPFDQPNVEAAKQRAHDVVETYHTTSALPEETPAATFDQVLLYGVSRTDSPEAALLAFLEQGQAGDYVTIQAYLPPPIEMWSTDPQSPNMTAIIRETTEIQAVLLSMCARIRDKYHIAATFGYGPRYLHATGQLHKGDAGRGLFIQVTTAAPQDVPIPVAAGELHSGLSFEVLQAAQALGDRRALAEVGRRVMRIHIREHIVARLTQLNQALL
jgi:glucose-6-phosphate isomerase/transaldolase/glucose-6-phosphate isomerase